MTHKYLVLESSPIIIIMIIIIEYVYIYIIIIYMFVSVLGVYNVYVCVYRWRRW